MDSEVIIPFIFFGFLAAVILIPILAKEQTKRSAHQLISHAVDRGQQLDPSLISQLSANMLEDADRARKTLGKGVILLSLAAGFVGAAYVAGGFDADARHGMLIPAIIFGAIGVAFTLLAAIDYMTKKPAN